MHDKYSPIAKSLFLHTTEAVTIVKALGHDQWPVSLLDFDSW